MDEMVEMDCSVGNDNKRGFDVEQSDLDITEIINKAFSALERGAMPEREEQFETKACDRRRENLRAVQSKQRVWYGYQCHEGVREYHRRRRIRFDDSSTIIRGLLDEIIHSALKKNMNRTGETALLSETQVLQQERHVKEKWETQDLPYFLLELCRSGESFGIQSFQKITRKCVQEHHLVNARLQCIRYKRPDCCRGAIVGKLQRSTMLWTLSRASPHNHESHMAHESFSMERYDAVIASIRNRIRDWEEDKSFMKSASHWNLFKMILTPFYCRESRSGAAGSLDNSRNEIVLGAILNRSAGNATPRFQTIAPRVVSASREGIVGQPSNENMAKVTISREESVRGTVDEDEEVQTTMDGYEDRVVDEEVSDENVVQDRSLFVDSVLEEDSVLLQ
ncbi:hypothetical protein BWQ96_07557 [Gracilariopsis chorda]|uniref:Uncharacterized protein n=1 Tax=Gracilariopsis chorda TaxID=448386 RepID=A0A2V3IKX8_9FLOR|nr:hypothetical protein BWQ96_07557 [Gracilariopsis chorda]|eukprot:PXF42742.1 hypothetical protein BWQ96_07557 [Gracilariopsis chorda]